MAAVTAYLVPSARVEVEELINRSRFLTVLAPIESAADARELQQALKAQHPNASHHCLAFLAGPAGCSRDIGASDDGEPAGSAGRPMLNVLMGSGLGKVAAVSVRYYGGTKLGVGGLVRAYAGGVKLALTQVSTTIYQPHSEVSLSCSYDQLNMVDYCLDQLQGTKVQQTFLERVELTVSLPTSLQTQFCNRLIEASKGQIKIKSNK